MLYLRTLGTLEIQDERGRSPGRLLARPKRLALLVRLAFAPLPRAQRRDALISLFWPEHDQERGRLALRQALHVLRRELGEGGEGVIVSIGDDALAVDPARLWCDAVAFDQALRRGDLEEAVGLYGGEFLPGFFLSESPEFEHWVERTRGELRAAAAAAAGSLADDAEAAGALEPACAWARRSLALASTDDAAARRLMRLLERAGDPAGALNAYAGYARDLATGYELEPSPETVRLAQSIRTRAVTPKDPTRDSPAERFEQTVLAAPAAPAAPVADARSTLARRRTEHRGWRRTGVIATLSAVLLLSSVFALRGRLPAAATDPPVSANRIAVFPFDVRGGGEHSYLHAGMVELLSEKLDGAGELSAVNPDLLLASAESRDSALDLARASAVAARFGAGAFVRGSVMESGDRLHIQATLFRRTSGTSRPRVVAEASVEGEPRRLLEMLDGLAARLLTSVAPAADRELTRRAALSTSSLPALKAYLHGEAEMRVGRWAEAAQQFERAVAEDTTFALAEYRLAVAGVWVGEQAFFTPAVVARALRHAERLPEHDRTLIRAFYAWRRGDAAAAEELYRSVVREYPDNVEAWHQLGETLFHYNSMRGRPTADARPAFERVLALDPDNHSALWHLTEIADYERNPGRFDSLATRLRHVDGTGYASRQVNAMQACLSGSGPSMARMMDSLSAFEDVVIDDLAVRCATISGNVRVAERLFRYAIGRGESDQFRTRIRIRAAYMSLAQGKVRAARALLDTLAGYDAEPAMQVRIWFALAPFVPTTPAELRALRDGAERLARAPSPATASPFRAHDWRYALGLLSAALGDERAALDQARALERLPNPEDAENGSRAAAQSVRAHAAWRRGRVPARVPASAGDGRMAAALAALDEEPLHLWYGAWGWGAGAFGGARERWLRAELLAQTGREREALRWYDAFGEQSIFDFPFVAPSYLRRAQIHERLGETRQAAEQYARFVDLWRDADPELQPLVTDARARLRALSSH